MPDLQHHLKYVVYHTKILGILTEHKSKYQQYLQHKGCCALYLGSDYANYPYAAKAEYLLNHYQVAYRANICHYRLHARQKILLLNARFIETGLNLSPFKLPLKSGVIAGNDFTFDGLFGVFCA